MVAEGRVFDGESVERKSEPSGAEQQPNGRPPIYPWIHLRNAEDVRLEMARVYRQMKTGELDSKLGCRLVYALSEMRRAIETDMVVRRLDAIEARHQRLLPSTD